MKYVGRIGALGMLALALAAGNLRAWAAPASQSTQRITYGQTVEGFISDTEEEQYWNFSGAAGNVVLIDMEAAEGSPLDPLLSLMDADGALLESDDDGGVGLDARIGPYTLPVTGTYTIVASRYNGSGSYRLRLATLDTAPRLAVQKTVRGEVNVETPAEYYLAQTDATEPELVNLKLAVEGVSNGPQLQIYAADGTPILSAPNATQNDAQLLLLPDTRYIVAVAMTDEGEGGAYRLMMEPADAALLTNGVQQQGQLTTPEDVKRHYFVGARGDVVQVTLESENNSSLSFYLREYEAETPFFSGEGSYFRRVEMTFTLPTDGAYEVGVYTAEDTTPGGSYTLKVTWLTD